MPGNVEPSHSIVDLLNLVDHLPDQSKQLFDRIFKVTITDGHLLVPGAMVPWVEQVFGAVENVERQRIVRVTNDVTGEAAIFNALRSKRPVVPELQVDRDICAALADDPWRQPLESTPSDIFGRLSNEHAVTAANVAKYDVHHSLILFNEPHPLRFDRESIRAYMELASSWFNEASRIDEEAVYPFLLWNCLWRAGSSIPHGHWQVQLARGRHYAKIESLRRASRHYRQAYDSDYFEDLIRISAALGLVGMSSDPDVVVSLTPAKDKEILIIANGFGAELADALFDALVVLRDVYGVQAFNVGIQMPPIGSTPEDWTGFPVIGRIIDRGTLGTRTSDIGSMELFAEPVIASDPFSLARTLRRVN